MKIEIFIYLEANIPKLRMSQPNNRSVAIKLRYLLSFNECNIIFVNIIFVTSKRRNISKLLINNNRTIST